MNKKKMALVHSVIALLLCCSMLIGTTFAWFTDSVTSGKNRIIAGNLDVELEYMDANGDWQPVNANTNVFEENTLWEPGHTEVVYLRVSNAGTLALTYQLGVNIAAETGSINVAGEEFVLSDYIEFAAIEGVETAFASRDAARAAVQSAQILSTGYTQEGQLMAGDPADYVAFVVYMPETVGNEANYRTGEQAPKIELGINLYATQEVNEQDSFNKNYDANAKAEFFDGFQGGYAVAAVTADDQGVTTEEVAVSGGDVSAVIPAGVQVAEGATSLPVSVAKKEASDANIQLGESDEMRPLDVHIEGVAAGNTVPMLITLKHYLSTGINTGALRLYHVENGATVAMTQVAVPANHNEFSYDPATGDVTLALASFSEVAVVADVENPWNGTVATAFADGSGTEADPYLIANADQLAYFRDLVDGKQEKEGLNPTFDGKFVKLHNHIYLNNVNFDPIGWGYENNDWNVGDVAGKPFKGTFDGGNNIIFNLYQNGWDLTNDVTGEAYTYTNCGFGLFAAAANATFKDLTIYGADIRVECVETGILVGLSQGSCTYDNINIERSKVANYQRPTGGLIGEVSPCKNTNGEFYGKTNITDVVIGADVVVGSLWGDFDAPCGGVIGARWDDSNTTEVYMDGVKVHCRMDVYSDVTSAYQWYAYRRAGMLIGNTEQTVEGNQHLADARFLTCKDVEVCYGDWASYHYCQFTNDNNPGKNYPWVRVEAGENNSAYSNPRYGHPLDVNGNQVTNSNHTHKAGDTCGITDDGMEILFNQLYGGGQGVYGQPVHVNDNGENGVTVAKCRYTITYMNDGKVLSVKYATGNKDVSTENKPAEHLVDLWARENKTGAWVLDGWMNAGSTPVEYIGASNNTDVVLYPYFKDLYTVTYVDDKGNVLHQETITAGTAKTQYTPAVPAIEGGYTGVWSITDFSKIESSVTVYPIYNADDGIVKLTPVDNAPADGVVDYYKVTGVVENDANINIVIPGSFNGKPVTEISGGAFAEFDNITTVKIPVSITTIGADAFANEENKPWYEGGALKYEQMTFLYEGTYAKWQAIDKDENWDRYVGKGSKIYFLADGTYIEETASNGTWNEKDREWSSPKTGTYAG